MDDVSSLLSNLNDILNNLGCRLVSVQYDGEREFDAFFSSEIRQLISSDLKSYPTSSLSIVRKSARYNGKDGFVEIYANHLFQKLSVCFYAGEYLFDIAVN